MTRSVASSVVTRIRRPGNTTRYDSLERLISESTFSASVTSVVQYSYDLVGNRTQTTGPGATNTYTLGTGNKLSSWGTNGTVSYADAGNVTNITYQDGHSLDIAWNDRYEITSVSTNGTTLESYEYDAFGRRVKIENAGSTNYLVYDGIHVVAEVDASGTLQKSYTYGPDSTGSRQAGVDNLLAMTDHTSTQTYFFVKDHLDSVVAVVDETGTNVVERYEYDAWGNVSAYDGDDVEIDESQIGNRYLWQGREYSWATGLYNFRARWYDAETGRWLSKDPIGISGGLNQYVFCGDNPVNARDPLGLCKDQDWPDYLNPETRVIFEKYNVEIVSRTAPTNKECSEWAEDFLGIDIEDCRVVTDMPERGYGRAGPHVGVIVPEGTLNKYGHEPEIYLFPGDSLKDIIREIYDDVTIWLEAP